MEKLIIKCDQSGGVNIDAENFSGSSCELATKSFEEVYVTGGKKKKTRKPEFFNPDNSLNTKQRF